MDRLYIITRADLPPGDQATQSGHAVSAFAVAYPDVHRAWHEHGKNLIYLACPDEAALEALAAHAAPYLHAEFREPDIGNALTALALAGDARRLVSNLPLTLKESKRAA